MLEDRIRIDAFYEALRGAIRPGAVVMDIGTGPGVMAILACELGASRVYAIESSEVIQVAREIAAANRCADKIEFFEDLSTNVSIPVKADVIVSDMRGSSSALSGSHSFDCRRTGPLSRAWRQIDRAQGHDLGGSRGSSQTV